MFSDSCAFSWICPLLFDFLVQFQCVSLFYVIIVYFAIFCYEVLETCTFLIRNRQGIDWNWKEGEEGQEGMKRETHNRLYDVGKELIFNKRKINGLLFLSYIKGVYSHHASIFFRVTQLCYSDF